MTVHTIIVAIPLLSRAILLGCRLRLIVILITDYNAAATAVRSTKAELVKMMTLIIYPELFNSHCHALLL